MSRISCEIGVASSLRTAVTYVLQRGRRTQTDDSISRVKPPELINPIAKDGLITVPVKADCKALNNLFRLQFMSRPTP